MPEGHTLHRLAREQQELVGASPTASSPQGRFASGATELDGRPVELVEAHGKHLHHRTAEGRHLHVHLGMQGKWFRLQPAPPPRPQVRLRLAWSEVAWDLIAPSTCELLDAEGWNAVVAALGPDPLRGDADPREAWRRVTSYEGPIGAALLDQSVIAGVGNVLRAEVLFQARTHPRRPASSLRADEFDELWAILVRVMRQAVDDGRILTAPVAAGRRPTIPEAEARMVYRQEVCRACGHPVETETLGGRTSYACPVHQPPP